ncbi:MAG: hypothetical protein FWE77_01220 [Clostridia bacterium]|nr:hypothetical protein [Clostridia bacterium]
MKKRSAAALCALLALALFGCGNRLFREEPAVHMSVSKYSDITERWFEETADGYKSALYRIEEITVERISDWLAAQEPSGQYVHYIYSDPDSWDLFVYYPLESTSERVYDSFSFCVTEQTVKLYVKGRPAAGEERPSAYILIRVQAPLRGAWPSRSELYVDSAPITLRPISVHPTF